MQRRLDTFTALGDSLVGQTDDLHARFPGRDHDLNLDGHALDALECNRTDTRHHRPPSSGLRVEGGAAGGRGLPPVG